MLFRKDNGNECQRVPTIEIKSALNVFWKNKSSALTHEYAITEQRTSLKYNHKFRKYDIFHDQLLGCLWEGRFLSSTTTKIHKIVHDAIGATSGLGVLRFRHWEINKVTKKITFMQLLRYFKKDVICTMCTSFCWFEYTRGLHTFYTTVRVSDVLRKYDCFEICYILPNQPFFRKYITFSLLTKCVCRMK